MYKTDVEAVDAFLVKYKELSTEIGKVIIGQDEVVKDVLISIFSKGHCLLIGVPGLAKTLLVNTIADVLGLSYNRIQFTPDLMPSDIIGSEILGDDRHFKFIKGPLFANIILADEIIYFQDLVRKIPVTENVLEFAVKLASKSRPNTEHAAEIANKYLSWGAGPRASQYLIVGAKCHAIIKGKYSPDIEDVKSVAASILRHRIVLNYKAEAEGISVDKIIAELLK